MKSRLALVGAVLSGLLLLVPDPIPFLDEGVLLVVFVKSMAALGYDVTRFVPFLRRKSRGSAQSQPTNRATARGMTVDV